MRLQDIPLAMNEHPKNLLHEQECVLITVYHEASVTVDQIANMLQWLMIYENYDSSRVQKTF